MDSKTPPITPTEEHLTLFAIMHFCLAGLLVSATIPSLSMLFLNPNPVVTPHPNGGDLITVGSPMHGFAIMASTIGLLCASVVVIAGLKLKSRRSRMFCMVVAGLECLFIPLGTVLGVFTLIVLNKAEARDIFNT